MTVLWDPYLHKSTSKHVYNDHIDNVRHDDDNDNHDDHDDHDDDVKFIAPDQWDYLYDIEVWHKKAVMHAW